MLLQLLAGHALCDYPLQGDFLARGKNHKHPIPGVPWQQCLLAHALIHAGAVYLITGSTALAWAELLLHAYIDFYKCEGKIGYNTDQFLHFSCKVLWCFLFYWGLA